MSVVCPSNHRFSSSEARRALCFLTSSKLYPRSWNLPLRFGISAFCPELRCRKREPSLAENNPRRNGDAEAGGGVRIILEVKQS